MKLWLGVLAVLLLSQIANPVAANGPSPKHCVPDGTGSIDAGGFTCTGVHSENADGSGPLCVGTWRETASGSFNGWIEKTCLI